MIAINQPITHVSVVTEPAPPAPVIATRLAELHGKTYKIKTPLSDHALYVTINDSDGKPFEIFINSKAMDHFQWIVALTRLISGAFRQGGDPTWIVEELRSVFDPKGGYFKKGGKYMPSLVAEIGDVVEQHLAGLGLIQRDESLAIAARTMVAEKQGKASAATLCAKCSTQSVVIMDGCATCTNCGDSKCG